MICTTAGFKQRVAFGLVSVALISAACSDDGDAIPDGSAGQSGSATAGKSSGGNSASGSHSGGSATAGKAAGGETSVAGTGGTTNSAGTGGSTATAGSGGSVPVGGEGGVGGEAGNGGESGASHPGGMGGEGGTPITGMAGAGGEGGAPFVADVLDNPGFEVGTPNVDTFPGWTNEGTPNAAYIAYSGARTGYGRLGHWTLYVDAQTPPYTARTYQTLDPIANGTYSFSIWVDRGWFDTQYLFARGFNAADPDQEVQMVTEAANDPAGYVKITLSGIVVTSGHCTVGVYSSAPAGTYTNFDDAEFTLE